MYFKKSQTATEYLIILAVVIVIALIVVGVLGGIPSIGGGANEQAARAALSSAEVGITGYSVSPVKGSFKLQNNQPNTIIINSITVNGNECWLIGTNTNPSLTPRLQTGESETVTCGSITAESGDRYDYPISINYTDVSTSATYTISDLELVGTGASFDCPAGFIPVPGGFILADGSTVDDFCVMKYEAKWDGTETISDDTNMYCGSGNYYSDDSCLDDNPGIASVPERRPLTRISYSNATYLCNQIDGGSGRYNLISDEQWMVIAENILNTPINDLDASASGMQLGNGNSNGPNAYAAGNDPVVSGCDLSQSLNSTANVFSSTCQLQGTNGNTADFGYESDGDSNFGIPYDSGDDSRAKLRTHVLSNGEVIWDLAGNVFEWSVADYSSAEFNFILQYTSPSLDLTNIEYVRPSQLSSTANGFGSVYTSSVQLVHRGGSWGLSSASGIFLIDSGADAVFGASETTVGFRCVYEPN